MVRLQDAMVVHINPLLGNLSLFAPQYKNHRCFALIEFFDRIFKKDIPSKLRVAQCLAHPNR